LLKKTRIRSQVVFGLGWLVSIYATHTWKVIWRVKSVMKIGSKCIADISLIRIYIIVESILQGLCLDIILVDYACDFQCMYNYQ
jgi:hypothetical protein